MRILSLSAVGAQPKPLLRPRCAFCACLLYGLEAEQSSCSNTRSGPPIDKDGELVSIEGRDVTAIQPPALLRYSPALFAKEAPEVFEHDSVTNVLRVKPGKDEPWVKPNTQSFLYCVDCYDRFISPKENNSSFIPFRDKASQSLLRPTWLERKRQIEAAQEEARADAAQESQDPRLDHAPVGDELQLSEDPPDERTHDDAIFDFQPRSNDSGIVTPVARDQDDGVATPLATDASGDEGPPLVAGGDDGDDEPPPLDVVLPEAAEKVERPTLEQYKAKWAALKEQHSKASAGAFAFDNLVPKPNWRLFQDCRRLSASVWRRQSGP